MKKLFAILMVICLTLSLFAFVSCNKGGDDGGSGNVSTTVTEEEWKKLFFASTVTINGTYIEDGEETVSVKVANNQCVISVVEADESFVQYMFYENGIWYCAEENRGLYYVDEATWISVGSSLRLRDIFEQFDYENMYGEFVYDETKKAYVYTVKGETEEYTFEGFTKVYTSYDSTVSIYVEDGKIAKIETVDGGYDYVASYDDGTSEVLGSSEATSGVYVFTDHSTTTIESFPSFCINHSFSSEWTIDDDEHWHACQTEKCGAKMSCDDHEYVDGACTTCGYQGN